MLSHAEQDFNSDVIRFILKDGSYRECNESEIIDFIESNGLNVDIGYVKNNSPLGDNDPAYDIEHLVYKDPVEILDDYWEEVTEKFFKYKYKTC